MKSPRLLISYNYFYDRVLFAATTALCPEDKGSDTRAHGHTLHCLFNRLIGDLMSTIALLHGKYLTN